VRRAIFSSYGRAPSAAGLPHAFRADTPHYAIDTPHYAIGQHGACPEFRPTPTLVVLTSQSVSQMRVVRPTFNRSRAYKLAHSAPAVAPFHFPSHPSHPSHAKITADAKHSTNSQPALHNILVSVSNFALPFVRMTAPRATWPHPVRSERRNNYNYNNTTQPPQSAPPILSLSANNLSKLPTGISSLLLPLPFPFTIPLTFPPSILHNPTPLSVLHPLTTLSSHRLRLSPHTLHLRHTKPPLPTQLRGLGLYHPEAARVETCRR
jgi:hypothetical protein